MSTFLLKEKVKIMTISRAILTTLHLIKFFPSTSWSTSVARIVWWRRRRNWWRLLRTNRTFIQWICISWGDSSFLSQQKESDLLLLKDRSVVTVGYNRYMNSRENWTTRNATPRALGNVLQSHLRFSQMFRFKKKHMKKIT